ncbi:MAG: histidinol-phosphate transaminase [Ruminococcaceae bacterium]|nr:histidinol-phosphate transaminase [Oscillospiraceae bacterium]
MSRFLNDRLQKIESYTPGEQPQDKKYIKLNTNESPYPPSEGVIKAITEAEIKDLRLYCDPECKKLKNALAECYNTEPKNIFLSNGSDDILNFSFMAYGQSGAAFPDITYGFYSVFAELYGIETEIIPLKEDFTIDIGRFCGQNKLVVIANPNAPTGIELSLDEIEKIVISNPDSIVLIDEAYVDFGGTSCAELTKKYKNLLCVGTFSKSRSMAGARLGFAIASKEIIADLEKIKYSTNPYNINRLTQVAGVKAIEENDYYMDNCKKICDTREYTVKELEALGFEVLPSKANFVFAKRDKISGEKLYLKLKENGVLVRHFTAERIKDFNRITIGSREEMEMFIKTVKEILGEKI